jgi:hypothetical protein
MASVSNVWARPEGLKFSGAATFWSVLMLIYVRAHTCHEEISAALVATSKEVGLAVNAEDTR